MAEESRIEWTHHTFNPWSGCVKVSPGCRFCYADASPPSWRRGAEWGPGKPRIPASESYWKAPLAWNRKAEAAGERHRVFCASMADVMEDRDDLDPWRARLWKLITETPSLDWLILTKRPAKLGHWVHLHGLPRNAWVGTSVEDQEAAEARIPLLLKVGETLEPERPVIRFLSMEPLLGPVDLEMIPCSRDGFPGALNALSGQWWPAVGDADEESRSVQEGPALSWVIVGGESGPDARPMDPDAVEDLRNQAVRYRTPFFFKQWGEWAPRSQATAVEMIPVSTVPHHQFPVVGSGDTMTGGAHTWRYGKKLTGRLLDGRTWDEFPTLPGDEEPSPGQHGGMVP